MDSLDGATNDWYNVPLNWNDIFAGGTLISLALIFLLVYCLTVVVLYRESRLNIGFLYLLSASINNMFLLINYALVPGLLILVKKSTPVDGRRIFQVYLDTVWFAMCYHIILIAWTRFTAVYRPCQFRKQTKSTAYILCFSCYAISLVQSIITYFQRWYVTFYYEPSVYGMIPDDIKMYLDGGKSLFFMIFHSTIIISTFILYSLTLLLLLRYNRLARNNFFIRFETRKIQTKLNRGANSTMPTEAKLVLPCICNTVVFLAGQVVITVGVGEGPWASWLIMILFTLTAATDPFSLLIFSGAVRKSSTIVLRGLFCRGKRTTPVVTIVPISKKIQAEIEQHM